MTLVTRSILATTLVAMLASTVAAQPVDAPATTTTATTTTAEPAPAPSDSDDGASASIPTSDDTRNEFSRVLRRHPPELATILTLDPTLLSNDAFLTGYPQLQKFVAEHPEVRRNTSFYLAEFRLAPRRGAVDDILEGVAIFGMLSLVSFVLAWLVRTIIEQKRWNRLSRTQSEVHNKILDRFGAAEELLAYIRSPAGSKFLESAPIPLRAEQASPNGALNRVLWSIQFGVIIATGAIGMLLVASLFDAETAHAFFAIGGIAFSVGAGFVASALVSLFLSRRLGLLKGEGADPDEAMGESGPVR